MPCQYLDIVISLPEANATPNITYATVVSFLEQTCLIDEYLTAEPLRQFRPLSCHPFPSIVFG